MTREDAYEFWGPEAVERALRDEGPEPVTKELTQEIQRRGTSLSPGAFRAWALAQPWPKFCAIIHVVAGVGRDEIERENGEDDA